jgi:uncharacterized membrane protein YgcG
MVSLDALSKKSHGPWNSAHKSLVPRSLRRLAILGLLSLLTVYPLAAREIVIQHFDEEVAIARDGTIKVTETIQAQFIGSNWHGIYRTIPVEYTTPQGLNYTLFLELLSITDESGQPLTYDRTRQGRDIKLKIYVPYPDNATRTVVIRYRVLNALTFFEDHDELYWNVTGNGWDARIEHATAQIELPLGVTGLRATSYGGAFGSRKQDTEVESGSNAVDFRTVRPLALHEGLTVVVGWDKGFVREPDARQQALFFLWSNWPLLIPVGVSILMFYWWWTSGRAPRRDTVTVQYEPPDNLTPAECGTIADDAVNIRDITATLVDLAVRGYLSIERQAPNPQLGLVGDYVLHLKKQPSDWNQLQSHEQQMLRGIFFSANPALMALAALQYLRPKLALAPAFAGGANAASIVAPNSPLGQNLSAALQTLAQQASSQTESAPLNDVALSDLRNRFGIHLPMIRNFIFSSLKNRGYYLRRPDTFRRIVTVLGITFILLMLPVGIALSVYTGTAPMPWMVAAILSGLVIIVIGRFMSARTIPGARAYAKVLGFEDFLGRVEKDRIERLEKTPELFEKYLPYAMALRVEKKWVQAFSGIALQPPQWYAGGYDTNFEPSVFVNDLGVMSSHAADVMSSAPRSSGGSSDSSSSGGTSGSGFSDSGGSGGGFGGGGGGGF